MEKHITPVFESLKKLKLKELHKTETSLEKLFEVLLPKKSKILSRIIEKKIFSSYDSMNIVLVAHLFIERLLNEILDKKLIDFTLLHQNGFFNTFYKKILFLKTQGLINEIADDILLFNNLRNKFAHKLNYDIYDFDFNSFIIIKKTRSERIIKFKRYKNMYYRILVKLIFFSIELELYNQYDFLYLIDE